MKTTIQKFFIWQILPMFTALSIISLAFTNCTGSPSGINDALITASVAAGTSAGLKLAIKDATKQHVIAQYINTYASALRTIVGNPTDEELTRQLMAFIPPEINAQYPELGSFAVPLIVSFYHWAKDKYGDNAADFQKVMNDISRGLETGSSCCLH